MEVDDAESEAVRALFLLSRSGTLTNVLTFGKGLTHSVKRNMCAFRNPCEQQEKRVVFRRALYRTTGSRKKNSAFF